MWHSFMGLSIQCDDCKCPKDLLAIKCNAEPLIKIEMRCPVCGVKTEVRYDLMTLKDFADDQDFKQEVAKENLLKAASRREYANDSSWLLELNILPEGMKPRRVK